MAVWLFVERKIIPGTQEEVVELLRELRSKAVRQQGFVSGRTLVDMYSPAIVMTVTQWADIASWEAWSKNPDRLETTRRMDPYVQGRAVVRLWRDDVDRPLDD
ncbi:MAG: hypothetical protein EXR67_00010 [Dehalococcoidia bacterium]|nr:hypothetical protein [Dehalococcoidia bacterium]